MAFDFIDDEILKAIGQMRVARGKLGNGYWVIG
jgi:hypothetical protein